MTQRWHGRESSQVKCAFWQCRQARLAFLRLPDAESLDEPPAADAGVPADEEAGLMGVEVPEGEGPCFVLRSSSFFNGEPEGERPAVVAAALEEGDAAFE